MWLEKLCYKAIRTASMLASIGFLIIGVVIVLQQVVDWLKYAIWKPYSIGNALHDWGVPLPHTPNMLGVQKIIDDILSWPAIVAYIILVVGFSFLMALASERLREIERKDKLTNKPWS